MGENKERWEGREDGRLCTYMYMYMYMYTYMYTYICACICTCTSTCTVSGTHVYSYYMYIPLCEADEVILQISIGYQFYHNHYLKEGEGLRESIEVIIIQ